MKSLPRSLVITAAVAAAAFSGIAGLSAQTPPPSAPAPGAPAGPDGKHDPQARIDHRLAQLTKALALTDAQQAQLKAVFEDEAAQAKALFENQTLSREDKHAQLKALHEAGKPKVEAVLTPDQKTKFEALEAEHEKAAHDRGAGGPPQ